MTQQVKRRAQVKNRNKISGSAFKNKWSEKVNPVGNRGQKQVQWEKKWKVKMTTMCDWRNKGVPCTEKEKSKETHKGWKIRKNPIKEEKMKWIKHLWEKLYPLGDSAGETQSTGLTVIGLAGAHSKTSGVKSQSSREQVTKTSAVREQMKTKKDKHVGWQK